MHQTDDTNSFRAERDADDDEGPVGHDAPTVIELEVVPLPGRPGFFSAFRADGSRLLRATRQTTYDGARALLAQGVSPDAVITTRHRGSAIVGSRMIVGEAAKWTVTESDREGLRRIPWRPLPTRFLSRPGVAENGDHDGVAASLPDDGRRPSLSCTEPLGNAVGMLHGELSLQPVRSWAEEAEACANTPNATEVVVEETQA